MSRREFSVQVRKDALKRSGMFCEAVGSFYGLPEGKRCEAPLGYGVEFDHIIADSIGGEPTLDNCAAVCSACHRIKTSQRDTPIAAKVKRIELKRLGIKGTGRSFKTNRNGPLKHKMNGTIVPRHPQRSEQI